MRKYLKDRVRLLEKSKLKRKKRRCIEELTPEQVHSGEYDLFELDSKYTHEEALKYLD